MDNGTLHDLRDPIDPAAARDVLGWAGLPGGWATGGFTSKLIDATCHADEDHQRRIALGFPELVHAVRVYQRQRGGVDRLTAAAQGCTGSWTANGIVHDGDTCPVHEV